MIQTSVDAERFSFQSKWLSSIGLRTPYEQWAFYGSVILSATQSFGPMYKYYYLRRYLDATDAGEKLIWTFKGRLSQIELDAGQLMLEDYRRTSRRYAMIPVAFIALELVKTSRSRSYLRTSGRISRLLLGVTICTYSTFAYQLAVIEQHDLNKTIEA